MPPTKPSAIPAPRKAVAMKKPAIKKPAQKRVAAKKTALKALGDTWLRFRESIAEEPPAQRIVPIRAGVNAPTLVDAARHLGVAREKIFELAGLPASTANRKISKRENLDATATERLARLALIECQAEETFGDLDMAHKWLQASNLGLGNCTPLSLLDTDVGAREVSKALVAIAYGGVA